MYVCFLMNSIFAKQHGSPEGLFMLNCGTQFRIAYNIPVPMAGAPGDDARQNSCRAPPTTTDYPSSSVDKQSKSIKQ